MLRKNTLAALNNKNLQKRTQKRQNNPSSIDCANDQTKEGDEIGITKGKNLCKHLPGKPPQRKRQFDRYKRRQENIKIYIELTPFN